jgi:5S rRNA maturation endonuclease (ribonuclease M5)
MKELKLLILELRRFLSVHPGWVVLVEGKRDITALESLGVAPVVGMSGRSFHDIAENLADSYAGVVLITDLDEEGSRMSRKLSKLLRIYGLKVDLSFRERLKALKVRYVEEIPHTLGAYQGGRERA